MDNEVYDHTFAADQNGEENVRGCSCGMADYGAPGHDGDPAGDKPREQE